ncbi:4-hydroxy-tetrahydrodipicolinate synthase [Nocardia sp. NPDC050710]|uniref:4-hydroxy-tetrahydrodipicolinate synthase n=1 Tax=Nocardia sp. NPDC050710 TaxID=3157220 RepID=UPI00340393CF
MSLSGLFIPLITPFTDDGALATDALESLAHSALDAGAAGIVALGTTGEPATLTPDERRRVLDICARVCAERRAQLLAGASSHSTADSVETLAALDPRITAALTVVPYYTRPSEAGVVAHFRHLAAKSPVPLIIYHVPHRTGRILGCGTLRELAEIPNVIGFKHAVGGVDDTTVTFLSECASDTAVLAGDDLHAAALLALGATGAILAAANLATTAYVELVDAWRTGPLETARTLAHRLAPLSAAVFAEPNPVVIKAVLAAEGHIPSPAVRLPLLPADAASTAAALRALNGIRVAAP